MKTVKENESKSNAKDRVAAYTELVGGDYGLDSGLLLIQQLIPIGLKASCWKSHLAVSRNAPRGMPLSSPAALHSCRMRMAAVAFLRVFLIIHGWTQVCGIPQEHLPREDGRGKRRFDCSEALLSIRQPHARGSFSLNHP